MPDSFGPIQDSRAFRHHILPPVQRRSPAFVPRPGDSSSGALRLGLAGACTKPENPRCRPPADPDRFGRQPPQAPPAQESVWINQTAQSER